MGNRYDTLLRIDEPHDGEVEPPQKHRPDESAVTGDPEFIRSGEDRYWREWYDIQPYYGRNYDEFQPAFQYGWEAALNPEFEGKNFQDIEPELQKNWTAYNKSSRTDWSYMRGAAMKAFERTRKLRRPNSTA